MPKQLTTKEFIERSSKIHNNFYIYSEVVYVNSGTKVKIKCPKHGYFEQYPSDHKEHGCAFCGIKKNADKLRYTQEEWIEKSKKIHGDKFDYSLLNYIDNKTPITLICNKNKHIFEVTPGSHLNNAPDCAKCLGMVITHEDWMQKIEKSQSDKFDYSNTKYVKSSIKIEVKCKKEGHVSLVWPSDHIAGVGCGQCANNIKKTTEEFIFLAKKYWGEQYDYSKSNYINRHEKIEIICEPHGSFWQGPYSHLMGHGCPTCFCSSSIGEREWFASLNLNIERNKNIKINGRRFNLDGYDGPNKTIYEFNGDYWHGNPDVYDQNVVNSFTGKTFGELYQKSKEKESFLTNAGFKVIIMWENDFNKYRNQAA